MGGADDSKGSVRYLLFGSIAGGSAKTVTAPLERLRVIFMTQYVDGGVRYHGVWRTLVKLTEEEGLQALWRGNGLNVVRVIPSSALRFFCFDVYKKVLFRYVTPGDASSKAKVAARVSAGGMAATTAVVATFPLDLVRTRLTAQTTATMRYKGILDAFSLIFRQEGLRGFYKGISAGILGTAPYIGVNFAVFDTLRERAGHLEDATSRMVYSVCAGAVSGVVAMSLTFPADVLRKQLMMQGIAGRKRMYSGLWNAVVNIWRHQGIRGFYRGLVPCYLKVVPSAGVSWGTIELCKMLSSAYESL